MKLKKLKRNLEKGYGARPDVQYFENDMNGIRSYFDYRKDNGLDEFLIDDTTWNDLSGDSIFKRINQGLSTSGEQYLYYLLRSPAIDKAEYDKRAKLYEIMEANPDLRLELQVILAKLGRRRAARTCDVYQPPSHGLKKMLLYILLVLAFLGSAISLIFSLSMLPVVIVLFIFLPIYHTNTVNRMYIDFATLNYSVGMLFAAKRVKKLSHKELNKLFMPCYDAIERLKSISRIGSIPSKDVLGELSELINSFLYLDLIFYELLKNRLGKHHEDIFLVHEYLGRLDSAIAVSSYRKRLPAYSKPNIDFESSAAEFHGEGLVHPLLDSPIPNDLDTDSSVLLTGSNASGKSTFLKTVALNAIFAQSICTVLGTRYEAPAFRIYTSMAITDDLLAGESYFISEIKSLKRITEVDTSKQPLLCVIDEVLRGTNTVERIAASSELLQHLSTEKSLCLAATHDIELCTLLDGQYRLLHFEESVTEDGRVLFDYKIKDGPATTRNAIKLLDRMGFDKNLVKRANEKAKQYSKEGKWDILPVIL